MTVGDYVTIKVKDNGKGMTDAVIKRVFEPFFTTKEIGEGTGLGLATCYALVRRLAGYIEVQSEPGKGSTFIIWLPRAG